jgi:hypothetical protein
MTDGAKLITHVGAQKVSLDVLRALPVPQGTATFKPIPHIELAEALKQQLNARSLTVKKEEYAIQKEGNLLFAVFDLAWMEDEETYAALGIRTSNDKSMSLQMAVGKKVVVCDNKLFAGQIIALNRRHTSGFDLHSELARGISRYQEQSRKLQDDVQIWKNSSLEERRAKTLLYDIVTQGVVPVRLLPLIHRSYFNNGYQKTAFGLLNACTEHTKKLNVGPEFRATVKLGRFFERRF